MYKVFEALDALVHNVERAYGVPMTSNCVVPRQDMLALLDDLRDALPAELDDAQDVLDHRDGVIREAEDKARLLVEDAEIEARDLLLRATEESDAMIDDATNHANSVVAKANDTADRTVTDARREADSLTERAQAEAERLIESGNDSYRRAVSEGQAEQDRLVSESEVVRRSNEEAHRIIDGAHADSNKLRNECDEYVDSKLAEFETSLSTTLRSVSADRTALRRGAGATGREPRDAAPAARDYEREPRSYERDY
ncbi:MAG: DivIVA domain-containing protein [Corynebacterium sp.]|uniref:DivIVA domain-containing protein n=1 Tax=uncultured Corynebacterium sp. TaxID=159447 RepID=UPI00180414CB|nr:DivIVA domain-containing protein [uncultured Corynebacterium sp.]NLZ57931.1 DivIVA domain-containing protein [Corynebacterium sp.]